MKYLPHTITRALCMLLVALLFGNASAEDTLSLSSKLLLRAAYTNDPANAKRLIANGADVNAKGDKGFTALHFAASHNAAEVAKLLIDNGAAVNAKDGVLHSTPLHFAALYNTAEVAKLLLENGAAVNAKNEGNDTPLHWAADSGSGKTAKLLIEFGAAVNTKNNDDVTPTDLWGYFWRKAAGK